MKKGTLANNFIYYLFCGFSGAVIACIVWLFLKLMSLGISFIWETVPSNINFTYYPLVVCTIGGILLGIYQKISKAVPDELEEVMEKGFSLLHTALTDESFISSLRALSNEAAVVELVYL